MNLQHEAMTHEHFTEENLTVLVEHLRCRLSGRVCDFCLVVTEQGLVIRGRTHTYYAKQVAQHAVLEATSLPIWANEIEVS